MTIPFSNHPGVWKETRLQLKAVNWALNYRCRVASRKPHLWWHNRMQVFSISRVKSARTWPRTNPPVIIPSGLFSSWFDELWQQLDLCIIRQAQLSTPRSNHPSFMTDVSELSTGWNLRKNLVKALLWSILFWGNRITSSTSGNSVWSGKVTSRRNILYRLTLLL